MRKLPECIWDFSIAAVCYRSASFCRSHSSVSQHVDRRAACRCIVGHWRGVWRRLFLSQGPIDGPNGNQRCCKRNSFAWKSGAVLGAVSY